MKRKIGMNEWISVKDGLPDPRVQVLVWDKDDYDIAKYDDCYGGFVKFGEFLKKVYYWMPLPDAPKDKAE